MAILESILFQNFRIFSPENQFRFEIAPITILTGPNNSGKSSVSKSILLLKNSSPFHLVFSKPQHKLGMYTNILNNKKKPLIFDFKISPGLRFNCGKHSFMFCATFNYRLEYKSFAVEDAIIKSIRITGVKEELILEYNRNLENRYVFLFVNIKHLLNQFICDLNEEKTIDIIDNTSVNGKYDSLQHGIINKTLVGERLKSCDPHRISEFYLWLNDQVIIELSEFYVDYDGTSAVSNINCTFGEMGFLDFFDIYFKYMSLEDSTFAWLKPSKHFLESDEFSDQIKLLEDLSLKDIVSPVFMSFVQDFIIVKCSNMLDELSFEEIHYVEAQKAITNRLYFQSDNILDQLLLIFSQTELSKDKTEFLNKWLVNFGIGENLLVKRIQGNASEPKIKRGKILIELADLGFGFTQLLTIILLVIFKSVGTKGWYKKSILIIEEPETNIHPNLQSLLASFFADVVKSFNFNLILETHSEYMIRKFQYLVSKKEVEQKDLNLYYLQGPAKEPYKIEIQDDGSLSKNFGPGFFDEAINWKFELLKLKSLN